MEDKAIELLQNCGRFLMDHPFYGALTIVVVFFVSALIAAFGQK